MIFTAVPTGSRVYIDANVFIYVFAEDRLLAAPCSDFLERIETGDIGGIISAHTLIEVAHRCMTLEACDVFGWPYAGIGRRLRKHPEKVRQLHRFRQALETITATNLNVVKITATSVLRAAELSLPHGLLNNDALILAVMESEGLAQVASTDSDFDRVPGIVRIVPS